MNPNDRVKLALEALDSAKQNVEHPTDCERYIDQAIAALSAPGEPSVGADGVERIHLHRLTGDQVAAPDGAFVRYDEVAPIIRRLSASRQVVPREAIGYVLSEGQVPVDVYITADAFEILIDAIYALQLPAPQPVAGIDEALKALAFIADRHDTPIVQKEAARRGLAAIQAAR